MKGSRTIASQLQAGATDKPFRYAACAGPAAMRRPGRIRPEFLALAFLLAVIADVLLGWSHLTKVVHGELFDPDSYMVLVRIRDALAHGSGFGHVVLRDASGAGLALPWSHAFDAVILLLRLALTPVLPPDLALYWSGVLTDLLSVGLLAAVALWAPAPLANRRWLWTAPFLVTVSQAIWGGYGQFGFVTHHVLLMAAVALTAGLAGRAAYGDVRAGALAGLTTAAGVWVSPEAMPFSLLAFGAAAIGWAMGAQATRRQASAALAAYGTCFLALVAVAFALDPPGAGYATPELDRISVVFLSLAAIICGVFWLLNWLDRWLHTSAARLLALMLSGGAGMALWLAAFPGYLHGLGGLMTPAEAKAFFGPISEMKPVTTIGGASLHLLDAVFATSAASAFAFRHWRRRGGRVAAALWGYSALCGVAVMAVGAWHVRFAIYAQLLGALMLPVLLSEIDAGWPAMRVPLLAAFLVLPPLPYEMGLLSPAEAATAHAAALGPRCSLRDLAPALAPYAGAVVLADVNDGPELLWRTRIRIVGSLYHTGIAAFMRLRAAWRERDLDHLPASVRAAGVQYVLICPDSKRSALVDGPADTLFDRLNRDDPPGWLRKMADMPNTGYVFYHVRSNP